MHSLEHKADECATGQGWDAAQISGCANGERGRGLCGAAGGPVRTCAGAGQGTAAKRPHKWCEYKPGGRKQNLR